MTEKEELLETGSAAEAASSGDAVPDEDTSQPVEPPAARDPMPPVESRFMFVDIAALRAKQLRRGALPRVRSSSEPEPDGTSSQKLERIAMAELEQGLIVYDIPDRDSSSDAEGVEETES